MSIKLKPIKNNSKIGYPCNKYKNPTIKQLNKFKLQAQSKSLKQNINISLLN
jgi:hypothetical protein